MGWIFYGLILSQLFGDNVSPREMTEVTLHKKDEPCQNSDQNSMSQLDVIKEKYSSVKIVTTDFRTFIRFFNKNNLWQSQK